MDMELVETQKTPAATPCDVRSMNDICVIGECIRTFPAGSIHSLRSARFMSPGYRSSKPSEDGPTGAKRKNLIFKRHREH